MRRLLCGTLRSRRGSVIVVTALGLFMMIGCAAIVSDVGLLYVNRMQLTNLADAAVLAGVQELPASSTTAVSVALSYARLNGKAGDAVDARVVGGTKLTVQATRVVPLFFARIFGFQSSNVAATAAAAITPMSSVANIVPFGIVKQELVFGQTYTLKLGEGDGYSGNFGALALGATGADNYRTNIEQGYKGSLKVGDWIPTETGDMSGPTRQGVRSRIDADPSATFGTVTRNSPRILTVPIIDNLTVSGRTDVLIVGFAGFFLEDFSGGGVNSTVKGKFMKLVTPGEGSTSAGSWGLYATRLVRY